MMKRTLPLMLIGISLLGCGNTPLPIVTSQKDAQNKVSYEMENGHQYCRKLSEHSDDAALTMLGFGIVGTVLASAAVIAGSAMGPDTSADANWAQRNRNSLVLGAGGLLAVPTTVLLTRSSAGNTASADAGAAMALDKENEALKKCLEVRQQHVASRNAAVDVTKQEFSEILNKIKNDEEQKAKKKLDEAKNLPADDPKKKKLEDEAAKSQEASDKARDQLLDMAAPPKK
ncbi:MAG TPA: hypothetical protein PK156_22935 [Polyangium sp.]|nr:hypothetical protein [Polyangium sp.]